MEKYKDLSVEQMNALRDEKQQEIRDLTGAENPTDQQIEQALALEDEVQEITAEIEARQAKADRFASLRTQYSEQSSEDSEDDDPDNSEPKGKEAEPEPEPEKEPEPVATGGVAELAAKTKRPPKPQRLGTGPVVIRASANVDGYNTGETLNDTLDVAKAVLSRAKGFAPPSGDGTTENIQKFGASSFTIDFPEELIVDRASDPMEVLDYAADETRLPNGSLTAAGGWCAPSETVYDLTQDATNEGILSLPEIGVRRGGIRFAQSPTFADFYANPGFTQTEAQAEAGTTKTCIEVDCPTFDEVRLEVDGVCIKVPILTNVGYPEYVRNFIDGTLVAHEHWMNANIIGRLQTAAGAARVITGLGATVSDTLEALTLLGDQTRQKYRLSMNRTLEVVVPFWVRGAMQADLSRRMGMDAEASDAEIARRFRERKLNPQFVYDWQALDETAEVYPATFNALMYPAGTFVKGTADVINLGPLYDAAELATNVYTGLFTEQGFLVAQRKFHADLITLPICNAGRVGANDLTCVVTP